MRKVRKVLLWVLTTAVPVFIAACYGVAYSFARATGRVVSSATAEGIAGIEVSCMRGGAVQATTTTLTDGSFVIEYDDAAPCETLIAEDVDGAENGEFGPAIIPFEAGDDGIEIELDPQA